jgi:hypothetical protein
MVKQTLHIYIYIYSNMQTVCIFQAPIANYIIIGYTWFIDWLEQPKLFIILRMLTQVILHMGHNDMAFNSKTSIS